MSEKFRMEARKAKCTACDLIFLIEINGPKFTPTEEYDCPSCGMNHYVEDMGDIFIVEE